MTNSKKAVNVKNQANKPAAKPAKFEWNDDNEAQIALAYSEKMSEDQQAANSTKFLASLAAKVGAKSGQAVRSKLSSMKVYKPLDKAAVNIAKPRITKPVLADEIRDMLTAAGVDISDESANSLANSNAAALKAVIAGLEMLDEPKATASK